MENLHGLFRDSRQLNRAKSFSMACEQCDLLAQQFQPLLGWSLL